MIKIIYRCDVCDSVIKGGVMSSGKPEARGKDACSMACLDKLEGR